MPAVPLPLPLALALPAFEALAFPDQYALVLAHGVYLGTCFADVFAVTRYLLPGFEVHLHYHRHITRPDFLAVVVHPPGTAEEAGPGCAPPPAAHRGAPPAGDSSRTSAEAKRPEAKRPPFS